MGSNLHIYLLRTLRLQEIVDYYGVVLFNAEVQYHLLIKSKNGIGKKWIYCTNCVS